MKTAISLLHRQWLNAKRITEDRCRTEGDVVLADKLASCNLFNGDESLEMLVDKAFSPEGLEFIKLANFPPLETLRRFKKANPEPLGVYIDCDEIHLTDTPRLILAGETEATIDYETLQTNRLIALHGAKVTVNAYCHTVIKIITDGQSEVIVNHSKDAIIIR